MRPYQMYILESETTGKFYIGSTGDLDDRLRRHNQGTTASTKSGRPWKVVYSEEFDARTEAVKREFELKNWKSHTRLGRLISGRANR